MGASGCCPAIVELGDEDDTVAVSFSPGTSTPCAIAEEHPMDAISTTAIEDAHRTDMAHLRTCQSEQIRGDAHDPVKPHRSVRRSEYAENSGYPVYSGYID